MQKNYSYRAGNCYMLRTPYLSAEDFANAGRRYWIRSASRLFEFAK